MKSKMEKERALEVTKRAGERKRERESQEMKRAENQEKVSKTESA